MHSLARRCAVLPSALALILAATAVLHAETNPPLAAPLVKDNAIENVRNARYCEIIPVRRKGLHLQATVYNTLGSNDCPPVLWNAITEDAMKKRFDALTVILNGPRHFVMDEIAASGATKAGKTIDVDGIEMTERATLDLGLVDLLHRPYRETAVDRDTRYTFKAGRPAFILSAPDGSRYVMQAYAQIVDKTLAYAGLLQLGSKLKLPSGWSYTEITPEKDLVLGAAGRAIVVQDDLDNTYQKLD